MKINILLRLAMLGTLALGTAQGSIQTQSANDDTWIPRQSLIRGVSYAYQVHLPESWTPLEKMPVILFLHGLGERGQDGLRQTRVGLGSVVSLRSRVIPAIVVAPQCPRGLRWDDPAIEEYVFDTLETTVKEYNGDSSRVYLTGISMGGYATYYFAARHPEVFAALVPVAGGVLLPREARDKENTVPDPAHLEVARKIAHIPTWIFHGGLDTVVPVAESRKMSRALTLSGGKVRYTEYPETRHNAWDEAYSEDGLFTWLLSHRKAAKTDKRPTRQR